MTKDEQHLHMAWEEDYHMQDPGRLALFDEYLEMSMLFAKYLFAPLKASMFHSIFRFLLLQFCNMGL